MLYFIPVYEWTLVWKDWRNTEYKMGSIWRPTMIENFNKSDFPGEMNRRIDGYDVRQYVSEQTDVVYFGDVIMPGHAPPNFVGTLILIDSGGDVCPDGIPCFERDKSIAKYNDLLFVTPDRNIFGTHTHTHKHMYVCITVVRC